MWRNVFISLWFAVALPVCQAADVRLPLGLSDKFYSQRVFSKSNGQRPTSLVPSGDGHFYGTTESENGGTIFKISQVGHPYWVTTHGVSDDPVTILPELGAPNHFGYTFDTLHSFSDPAGGKNPLGPLVVADGAVYGVTRGGGAKGLGTVFRMSPEGTVTILHSFGPREGASPEYLMRASDGNFYGILSQRAWIRVLNSIEYFVDWLLPTGPSLFKMTPAGEVTILDPEFATPFFNTSKREIVEDGAGALYVSGTLLSGKPCLLKYSKSGERLAAFEELGGATALLKGKDGNIYVGCNSGIVRITPAGEAIRLGGFNDRSVSIGSLTEAANGDLYGIATAQLSETRTQIQEYLFRLGTEGKLEILTIFTRDTGKSATSLVQGTDGVFYGVVREYAAPIFWGSTFAYFPPFWTAENKAPKLRYDHAGPGVPVGTMLPPDSHVFERLNVLANDFDPEDGALKVTAVSDPRVEILKDQTLSFQIGPDGGKLPVSITYTVKDSLGATAIGTIMFSNRAPVAGVDKPPVTVNSQPSGTVYKSQFTPLVKDADYDELRIVSVSDRRVSIASSPAGAEQLIYQETVLPGVEPLGNFTYTITDGRGGFASGTVILRNRPPVAQDDVMTRLWTGVMTYQAKVLSNDSDPDGDPLTVIEAHSNTGYPVSIAADGTLSVSSPDVPSEGVKIFYTVSDGYGGTASATATAPLGWVVGSPVAQDDRFALPANEEAILDVLANDIIRSGSELLITEVNDGGRGIVSISPDGKSLMYHPGATSAKTVTFTYTVSNERGSWALGVVTIYTPFKAARGTYHTIIGAPFGVGAVRLRLTRSGQMSGTLQFNGSKYPWSGKFDAAGALTINLPRGETLPALELSLFMKPRTGAITGTLTDGENEVPLSFDEAVRSAPPELVGYYTVALPADPAQPKLPQGDGFAMIRVRASGVVGMSGKLGDGTSFSAGSRLHGNGTVSLYGRAYGNAGWNSGGLTGTGRFTSDEGQASFLGSFRWIKLPKPESRFYPAGFVGQVSAIGSQYSLAPNSKADAVFGAAPVTLKLSGGNLFRAIPKSLTFHFDGKAMVFPVAGDQLGLWLSPSTGLISGTFRHPENGQMTAFTGIALPQQKRAYGVFRGTDQAGSLRIKAE